ncbi:hypothetical protein HaLaN_03883 [Haematococcus lacustris]|uniref:Uncharacterized protein n=1 Tax=Haematococcus lacustris TaxID=44745 RepID=A0A699YHC3_HAELA|nr:hypothetical protein HaLaN_03883 [Haematococcus lacustris]
MAEVPMERYGCAKQLVVGSGAAGIGTSPTQLSLPASQLQEQMAEVSMECYDCAKQLVVGSGTPGIGTCGGWDAAAVLRTCCKVVCRPGGTDQH